MTTIIESEYTKQGREFLDKVGAKMTTKFLFYGPHFPDDKESRDVYEITFTRKGRKPWSLKFGQSIAKSCNGKEHHLKTCKKYHQWKENCFEIGHRVKPTSPTEYDVLACLTKYDPGTFSDFCGEFGYDNDSIKAQKTYFAVQEEWENVRRMFGDALEALQEIQQLKPAQSNGRHNLRGKLK